MLHTFTLDSIWSKDSCPRQYSAESYDKAIGYYVDSQDWSPGVYPVEVRKDGEEKVTFHITVSLTYTRRLVR